MRPRALLRAEIKALLVIAVISFTLVSVSYGLFAGGHTVFVNKTSATYGGAEFCVQCHKNVADTVMVSEHNDAGCICHGYNPNVSAQYDVNLKHNLTKDVYCTNCHSNYNETGEIEIYDNLSGLNQSGHYITGNISVLYNHSREFFN